MRLLRLMPLQVLHRRNAVLAQQLKIAVKQASCRSRCPAAAVRDSGCLPVTCCLPGWLPMQRNATDGVKNSCSSASCTTRLPAASHDPVTSLLPCALGCSGRTSQRRAQSWIQHGRATCMRGCVQLACLHA